MLGGHELLMEAEGLAALPPENLFGPLIAALHTGDAREFVQSFDLALERARGAEPAAADLIREFIVQLKGQGRRSELAEVARQPEGETMVRATLADLEQQMRQRGMDQGWQQGMDEGRRQGMQQGMQGFQARMCPAAGRRWQVRAGGAALYGTLGPGDSRDPARPGTGF